MPVPTVFRIIAVGMAIICLAGVRMASAQQSEPNRINIEYGEAKDPAHQELRQMLRRHAVLERVQSIFSPVKIPRPLTFRTAGCNGEMNAWFGEKEVVLCYELVEDVVVTALSRRRPAWLNEEDAIRGPLVNMLLHEGAHALFAYLDTPIFGREEDAADQFAAYLMLSLGKNDVLPMAGGIVYTYMNEAGVRSVASLRRKKLRLVDGKLQADAHSTPIQRMYSFLCLAYGAAPEVFREVVKSGALPDERVEGCADEFRQVDKAFRTLILPHLDAEVLKKVLAADTLSIGR
jgi:Putative metallopeptidase